MSKPIIAIDIDDVIAAYAEGFANFSNERWGTNLKPEDYHEGWTELWKIDFAEVEKRANELYTSGAYDRIRHFPEAKEALEQLKQKYVLVAVTSRRNIIAKETWAWLDKNFKNVFREVHFAGIWDSGHEFDHAVKLTKTEISKQIGADYLIDDQPKHCFDAATAGLQALLYGDYPWNRNVKLPKGVTRCKDWAAVLEYFDGRS